MVYKESEFRPKEWPKYELQGLHPNFAWRANYDKKSLSSFKIDVQADTRVQGLQPNLARRNSQNMSSYSYSYA